MSEKYTRDVELGEGAYGKVYRAFRKSDGLALALKRMKGAKHEHGANPSAIREIKHLQKLTTHANVIRLYDVYSADDCIHMVLELCPCDLDKVIKEKKIFLTESHIKTYFRMMLDGLAFCHANFVLHRDMKPENLLIGSDGQLRLADFGLAKSFPSSGNMTAQVATIWYRPPELLFGAKRYSAAIDVWGAGCIFAEMMLRNPLFQAESESAIEQLQKIFNVLGTPAPDAWPGVTSLPDYVVFTPTEPLDLRHLFVNQYQQPPAAFNVLMQLLQLDPNARGSCEQALEHEYFTGGARLTPAEDLPHKLLMSAAPRRGSAQAGEVDEGTSPDHKRRRR